MQEKKLGARSPVCGAVAWLNTHVLVLNIILIHCWGHANEHKTRHRHMKGNSRAKLAYGTL